jgi:sugar fermentation stimulation protein A
MKFSVLVPGVLVHRKNRFTADVRLVGGKTTEAYVPTTGRLTGVLRPGCQVWLEKAHDPGRKTAYTLLLSESQQGGLCSVNAALANALFAEAVTRGGLAAYPCEQIEKEITHGHSRLDFRLSSRGAACWVEVKSVTYVEDGVGMFPDAPTARGRRHLEALAGLAEGGDRASVVFIAQRGDAQRFTPYEAVDPAFAETLRRVHQQGVAIHAYRCDVTLEGIEIAEEIPVVL